jgi:hypothetical protein
MAVELEGDDALPTTPIYSAPPRDPGIRVRTLIRGAHGTRLRIVHSGGSVAQSRFLE